MINTVKLESGKSVELAANAATPFRFKQLFNTDLLKVFQEGSQDEASSMVLADTITQLAFIMNRQASGANMNALSLDDFYTWLEDYDAMDFVMSGQEIINIYLASAQSSVEAKKKQK